MNSTFLKHTFLFLSLLCISFFSFSISGLQTKINYTCIGQDSFLITLQKVVDCSISTASFPDSIEIQIENVCATSYNVYLSSKTIYNPSICIRSICNGGNLPGIQILEYSSIVTLNSLCSIWTLSYTDCCTDTSSNLVGNPPIYTETQINMYAGNCNTSPPLNSSFQFAQRNELNILNLSCTSLSGSFLYYYLEAPLKSKDSTVVFQNGYTGSEPIQGISLDSNTGILAFTPKNLGKYYASIRIDEVTPNANVLISSSVVNILIHVIEEKNSTPISHNGIENITGNLFPIGIDSFQVNYSESISFDINYTDSNNLDSISILTNVNSILPNATFTILPGNPAKISINWKSTIQDNSYVFSTVATDDNCQPEINTRKFTIFVGNDLSISNGQNSNYNELQLYPNPIKQGYLMGRFHQSNNETSTFLIYDIQGTLKKTIQPQFENGFNNFKIDVNELPIGTYLLRFHSKTGSKSIPFLKN